MAEDTKQPDITKASETDASSPAEVPADAPASGDSPQGTSADAEKSSKVEDAKARVASAKEVLSEKAAAAAQTPGTAATPGAPKAPVKKKEEGPKPTDASGHPQVTKLKGKLNGAVLEASEFLGQLSIRIDGSQIVNACEFLRDDLDTPFNYLSDITCVHFPDRAAAPFEVVYNLY